MDQERLSFKQVERNVRLSKLGLHLCLQLVVDLDAIGPHHDLSNIFRIVVILDDLHQRCEALPA